MPILAPVARPPAAVGSEEEVAWDGAVVSEAADGVGFLEDVVTGSDVAVSNGDGSDVENGWSDIVDGGCSVDVNNVDGGESVVLETAFPTTFPAPFKMTPLPSSQHCLSLSQQYFPSSSQMVTRGNFSEISSTPLGQCSPEHHHGARRGSDRLTIQTDLTAHIGVIGLGGTGPADDLPRSILLAVA